MVASASRIVPLAAMLAALALSSGATEVKPAAGGEPAPKVAASSAQKPCGKKAVDVAALDPGMPEGAVQTLRTDRPFDRYPLPVGPFSHDRAAVRFLEGRVVRSAYRLDDAAATTAAVTDIYRRRLLDLGYDIVLDCISAGCGGLDFRFAVELLPAPAMVMDAADFAQLSGLQRIGDGRSAAVSVLVSRALGAVHVQVVVVLPASPSLKLAQPAAAAAVSERPLPVADERALFEQIERFGHAVLTGVVFESGGATLASSSGAALDAAAEMMKKRPEIKVIVVGHTDNQGPLEANIALSRKRAETVRGALIARGVEKARLRAEGVGYLAPVASNATAEGRARNRRVELVLE